MSLKFALAASTQRHTARAGALFVCLILLSRSSSIAAIIFVVYQNRSRIVRGRLVRLIALLISQVQAAGHSHNQHNSVFALPRRDSNRNWITRLARTERVSRANFERKTRQEERPRSQGSPPINYTPIFQANRTGFAM